MNGENPLLAPRVQKVLPGLDLQASAGRRAASC